MSIDYSQKIPNNVNLQDDRTLQRALEQWQPNFINWWMDMGPSDFQSKDVWLRTAISVDADGCVWLALLFAVSVTVHVTVVWPSGNVAGASFVTRSEPPQLSWTAGTGSTAGAQTSVVIGCGVDTNRGGSVSAAPVTRSTVCPRDGCCRRHVTI